MAGKQSNSSRMAAGDAAHGYVPGTRAKVPRNKLGVVVAGVLACPVVAIIGGVSLAFLRWTTQVDSLDGDGFLGGVLFALFMASLNFFGFFISAPLGLIGMAFTLGRKPHAGKFQHGEYYRDAAIVGAVSVSAVTGFFGASMESDVTGGAIVGGALVGALSGAICTWIYLAIVRPNTLAPPDLSVFD